MKKYFSSKIFFLNQNLCLLSIALLFIAIRARIRGLSKNRLLFVLKDTNSLGNELSLLRNRDRDMPRCCGAVTKTASVQSYRTTLGNAVDSGTLRNLSLLPWDDASARRLGTTQAGTRSWSIIWIIEIFYMKTGLYKPSWSQF